MILNTKFTDRSKNAPLNNEQKNHGNFTKINNLPLYYQQLTSCLAVSRSTRWKASTPPASHRLSMGEKTRGNSVYRETAKQPVTFVHQPVMLHDFLHIFEKNLPNLEHEAKPFTFVDATLGGGGHSRALLEKYSQMHLIGIDQDLTAIQAANKNLKSVSDRVQLFHERFDALENIVTENKQAPVLGVLFDLGVSSPQLDVAERGFSYKHDAPLDMRMDIRNDRSAKHLINESEEQYLASILHRFGDERFAKRIAQRIVQARPINTTQELAEIVKNAIPAASRRHGGHPAKRTFQALRIEINSELEILPKALLQGINVLSPGGVIGVLTYHSGEDRLVKACFLEEESGGCSCPIGYPCICGAVARLRIIKRGGYTPSVVDIAENPRAKSARLRVAQRVPLDGDGDIS